MTQAVVPRNANGFLTHVDDYFRRSVVQVEWARNSGAAWEVWLQVELWIHCQLRDLGFPVVREAGYTGRNQRADFGIGNSLVELKAQTRGETDQSFRARAVKDINRIGPGNFAIAVYWTQGYLSNEVGPPEVAYTKDAVTFYAKTLLPG